MPSSVPAPSLLQQVSLRPYNTFGIDVPASAVLTLTDKAQLPDITADPHLPRDRKVLGGGSNVLLTGPVTGLVILNRVKGITVEREDDAHTWLRVLAGEIWHDLVLHAIGRDLGGLENLALIPGTTGAAPIQNIGAYGAEARETIESVEAWHWEQRAFVHYTAEECRFGYRDSIFKGELKDKVLITSVLFRLSKHPVLKTGYGAITAELEAMGAAPSIQAIAQAVIAIRRSKLPDPAVTGNAGSFFKNPTISLDQYRELEAAHPGIPSYPVNEESVKVPAGWLIEQCGWKGKRKGATGVHPRQALVLVNYGGATGAEVWALSEAVVQSVAERFGILLEREVQVW